MKMLVLYKFFLIYLIEEIIKLISENILEKK